MGTYSRVSIKVDDMDTIVKKIENSFDIGRKEFHCIESDYYFYDIETKSGGNAFIISQDSNLHWVDVRFPFSVNLYYFDEFLRRLSSELNTEILLGYAQSTSSDARVAKFSNGKLVLSLYQQLIAWIKPSPILLLDDYGIDQFKSYFQPLPRLGQNFENYEILDFDDIQQFFITSGRTYDFLGYEYEEYLHLEWLS